MYTFLYPSLPFSVKTIDPMYEEEQSYAQSLGFNTVNIDIEELFSNKLKLNKPVDEGVIFIYRGWMLKENDYQRLENILANKNLSLINNTVQYLQNHYISGWYPQIEELTFKSIYQENYENIQELLEKSGFKSYFIKDYVKSLTTSRGSIAHNIKEAKDIVNELINKRGEIEKGLCIREFTPLSPTVEERYFVFLGTPYSRNSIIPDIVKEVVSRHKNPFFSVDVAQKASGENIVVEIGDGQVSDTKLWNLQDFYNCLKNQSPTLKMRP